MVTYDNIYISREGVYMEQQKYKQFKVSSKNDFLIYLRFIITAVHRNLTKFNIYTEQLNDKIKELDLYNKRYKSIDSEIYEEFNDKVHNVSGKLKNLLGDNTNDALSYYKFRKRLVKKNLEVNNALGSMSENLKRNLNDVNELRNWGLHEPESLLNAHLENISTLWPENEVIYYKTVFNPIMTPVFVKYEGAWLISLYRECKDMGQLYSELYDSMLSDYQILIGTEPQIKEVEYYNRPLEIEVMLPQTSFQMQQKKYKRS